MNQAEENPRSSWIWSREGHYFLNFLGLFSFAAAFTVLRDQNAYFHPIMGFEDGKEMFAYYTNERSPLGVLRLYSGYVSLLPNIIGYISAQIRPSYAPYVLAWFPLIVSSVVHSIFYLPRYRFLLPSDRTRLLICLILTLMPLGFALLVSNTTYSLWNLLLLLVLLTIAPIGRSRVSQVLQVVVMGLAAWSHPLSLVVIPICIVNLYTRRDSVNRALNIFVILAIVFQQLFAISPSGSQMHHLIFGSLYSILYVLDRVVVEALVGYQLRLDLFLGGYGFLLHIAGILALCGLFCSLYFLRRSLSRSQKIYLLLILYVVLAITALSAITRIMDATSHMGQWNFRYFYVQQFLFLLITAILLAQWASQVDLRFMQQLAVGSAIILFLGMQNLHNLHNFQTPLLYGTEISDFMDKIEDGISHMSPSEVIEFKLERIGNPGHEIIVRYYK